MPLGITETDNSGTYSFRFRNMTILGAYQNRLEHSIKINDNIDENTQVAESLIRDTDMATEMIRQNMQNILAQSGVSMLTQANQNASWVLNLLQ